MSYSVISVLCPSGPEAPSTPYFSEPPIDYSIELTKKLELKAVAKFPDCGNPIQYQWFQGSTFLPGETSTTLKVDHVTFASTGFYQCIAVCGDLQVCSRFAEVQVNKKSIAAGVVSSVTVSAPPRFGNGTSGVYPGPYTAYASFRDPSTGLLTWTAPAGSTSCTITDGSGFTSPPTNAEWSPSKV